MHSRNPFVKHLGPALAALALISACGKSGSKTADDAALWDVSTAPARYRGVAQTFSDEVRASGAVGAAMGIIEGGVLTYSVGVGRKDPRTATRVEPTTLFRIGSITKMMTSLAVMQEVQAGNVGLDDLLVDHVPGFHLADGDPSTITIRHLLEHTSGLYDYLELDAPPGERGDDALLAFLTGRFGDPESSGGVGEYLMVDAGRFYNYSNPNFELAGLVAQESSGVLYRQLMSERVFGPLGMTRTFFLPDEVLADGDYAASSSAALSPSLVLPDRYDNPWGRPAGFAWSSVSDLATFAGFLMNGDEAVLAADLHAQMTSPTHSTQELLDLLHYGYGLVAGDGFWLGSPYYAVHTLSHGGNIPGYSAEMFLIPDLGFGIVWLTSGDEVYFSQTLGRALSDLPALPSPSTPPDIAVDPATFTEETGTYVDPHLAGEVTVTLSAGSLRLSAPAADAAGIPYDPVLAPASPRNFVLTLDGQQWLLTFIHGSAGEPTWMRTRLFVAERAPSGLRGAQAGEVDPERFRRAVQAARME